MASSSSRTTLQPKEKLYNALMNESWKEVEALFKNYPEIHDTKIADMVNRELENGVDDDDEFHDTALHWAISNKAQDSLVKSLVDQIKEKSANDDKGLKVLKARNKRGDTPLHCAASRGSAFICANMINDDKLKPLVLERNNLGETPLFSAALSSNKETFLCLHQVCSEKDLEKKSSSADLQLWERNNRDTILHCTIQRRYFGLSYEIIKVYEKQNIMIGSCFNEKGRLPLDELVSIPSAFKNGTCLVWWQKWCYCLARGKRPSEDQNSANSNAGQTQSAHQLQVKPKDLDDQNSSNTNNFLTQLISLWDSIRKMKEDHVFGDLIMEELVKQDPWYMKNNYAVQAQEIQNFVFYKLKDKQVQKGRIKISTALLIAAKNGLVKQVQQILDGIPVSIHDQLLIEKRNIIHVAIEERQSHVLEIVKKHKRSHWHALIEKVDNKGNNALHLAATKSKHTATGIRGPVMQMQWEVMWFEYVKMNTPSYFISQSNNEGKTPWKIFIKTHEDLIEKCNKSVKDTCEPYIIAATLIAGATFSACYQAPDRFGHTFYISLLISFCFSITSLTAFLCIYSTRNGIPKNFRRILPFYLCLGFFTFFASLVSMLVTFYAALSHDFHPKEKYQPIISYSVILFPAMGLYIFTQIPLYLNLLIVSFFKKVPKPRVMDEDDISHFFQDSRTKQKNQPQQPAISNVGRAKGSTEASLDKGL